MRYATHELKSWPEYFQATIDGDRTFELRKNDRDFKVRDRLIIREFNPNTEGYTEREVRVKISYVLTSSPGLQAGYCCLGLKKWG
jgi:hypothetical protein